MKELTLRQLSNLTGLNTTDLAKTIQATGADVPDIDSPLSQSLCDLLTGTKRKKSLGLSKPLGLSKKEPVALKPTVVEQPVATAAASPEIDYPKETPETTQSSINATSSSAATESSHKKVNTHKAPHKDSGSKTQKKHSDDESTSKKTPLKSKSTRQDSPHIKLGSVSSDGYLIERSSRRPKHHQVRPQRSRAPSRPTEIKLIQDLTVTELARKLQVTAHVLQKGLKSHGMPSDPSSILDIDTAVLIANEMGVQTIVDRSTAEDLLIVNTTDEIIESRAPIVTIMGHVDHGKTSLLDALRKSNVTDSEAGGITQHIGAYQIHTSHGNITFLDTPGHEAFTAIRSRGASCTDIVILVVACDDGIMPQTREAVQHAQAANVKIIVALTKIDKEEHKTDEIKNQLSQYDIVSDEWGGNTQFIGVSAKTGEGLSTLLEAISVEAEMLELKARTSGPARGIVLEAKLDKSLGPVATVLIQEGQLKVGDNIIMGIATGKVRRMNTASGDSCKTANPSFPVEVIGMSALPEPADTLNVVKSDKIARLIIAERTAIIQKNIRDNTKSLSLDEMFSQIRIQDLHQLNVILKADAHGSMGAISEALNKLSNDELQLKLVGSGVGAITKSDVELATASNAIIVGFNVRPDNQAKSLIDSRGTEIYYFSIIYELITRIKDAIKGIIGPKWDQEIIGTANVREVFRSSKFGAIAGCIVQEGFIKRHAKVRVIRDHIVIFEGSIHSLRRSTQDVEEVRKNTECGVGIKDYTDIRENDSIEAFILVERANNDS